MRAQAHIASVSYQRTHWDDRRDRDRQLELGVVRAFAWLLCSYAYGRQPRMSAASFTRGMPVVVRR